MKKNQLVSFGRFLAESYVKPSTEQGRVFVGRKILAALEKVRENGRRPTVFNLAREPQQIDLAVEALAAAESAMCC